MAVTFVIGRAGTGKTHRCFRSIVDALRSEPLGPRIFWLLPRQATFSAERDLTLKSGLGGFVRAQVLSFEQLGKEIVRDCGGASIPEITPLGRQMILGHLLRREADSLKFFRDVARQPGLAAKLDATFSEFERGGKDASDLDTLLHELAGDAHANPALLDKVDDLRRIYLAYSEYLGQERLDQHRRLLLILDSMDACKLFGNATVYVDGFSDFSEYERRMLAQLGKTCRRVEITLSMDPASPVLRDPAAFPEPLSLFHPVEMTYRRLRAVFREECTPVVEPPVVLSRAHRFRTPALRAVERYAVGITGHEPQAAGDGVELIEAPDRAAEVDAVARRIRDFLKSGLRLRDIAVLARDLPDYHDTIEQSFAEHGIPYFVDARRKTAHHPLVQLIRCVLSIAGGDWPHDGLMAMLKTDLTGIAAGDADALENYVLAHRIRGDAWVRVETWAFHAKSLVGDAAESATGSPATDARVERDRRAVADALSPFVRATAESRCVREIVAALFEVLERFGVRLRLAQWIETAKVAGHYELMSEHAQVWGDLIELFDQMVELLGEETVSMAGFQEILDAALEQFDLGLTPPMVDEVLVGQVDRTRLPEVRATIILGLAEGVFPRVPRENSVLTDSDRREFQRRNLDVAPVTERRLLDEALLGYFAFASPSEFLCLARPLADAKGNPLGPSVFWRRLAKVFPGATRISVPRTEGNDVSYVATPRQLAGGLMRWVRAARTADSFPAAMDSSDAAWGALYQWFATHPSDGGAIDRARSQAWPALSDKSAAALTPEIGKQLFPSPLRTDVRQIETFAACPFRHFARHGLGLKPRDDGSDVTAMDLGRVYHHVLEKVAGDLLKRGESWSDLTDARRRKLIRDAVRAISHELRGEIMLGSARNEYMLGRIARNLDQVVQTQTLAEGRGHFRTALGRVRFGEGSRVPELVVGTPNGGELRLSGSMDRIDVHADGTHASVIDYRMGERTLVMPEAYHGLALNLLTQLIAVAEVGSEWAGKALIPVAAFYVKMMRRMGEVDHPSDAVRPEDPSFHLSIKPRGVLDETFLREMDPALTEGKSQIVHATIKKDGGLGSRNSSDLASPAELGALLSHARAKVGELADGVIAGDISVRPYLLGNENPCPNCEFRGVCRFESRGGYQVLAPMRRDEVLRQVVDERGER